jgi:hypothetical protein
MNPYHSTKVKTLEDVLERTELVNNCLVWTGATHRQGYGMMRQAGEMRTVHSVVAELKYGERPTKYNGTRVTRTCGNKLCVNPDHIVIEESSKIKRRRYHCKNRRLTQEQVREVRKRYAEGEWGIGRKLAKEYNVSHNTIYATVYNRLYKEIPDENE